MTDWNYAETKIEGAATKWENMEKINYMSDMCEKWAECFKRDVLKQWRRRYHAHTHSEKLLNDFNVYNY